MLQTIDDLGTEVSVRRGETAGRAVLLLVIGLVVVASSLWMEGRVAETMRRTEGAWTIDPRSVPDWIPVGFVGTLGELETLPERVALRTSDWRERLKTELLAHPWIDSVESIERRGPTLRFAARFRRPVLAVPSEGGHLLIDSTGRVLDWDPQPHLDPAWGLPIYSPQRGELPALEPGTPLDAREFEECLAIVRELWAGRVLDSFPGAVPVIDAYVDGRTPGLLWRLHTQHDVHLYWGRSPASDEVSLRSVDHKIRCLDQVLRAGDGIRGAGGISLYDEEPLVVGRR